MLKRRHYNECIFDPNSDYIFCQNSNFRPRISKWRWFLCDNFQVQILMKKQKKNLPVSLSHHHSSVYVSFLEIDEQPAPAVKGKRRRATPGRMVVAAYDLAGNLKWRVKPGVFSSVHGFCSSPVIYKGSIIVNGDHDGEAGSQNSFPLLSG